VDTALHQNEAELGVFVLPEAVQVLAHRDGLLDHEVEVLGDLGGQAGALQDAQNLGAGHRADLRNAVGITQDDADLGGGHALLGQLADVLLDLRRGDLQPGRGAPLVGESGAGEPLALAVHATHGGEEI
jgi:hypothetical protein